jgi:hypothetical protein
MVEGVTLKEGPRVPQLRLGHHALVDRHRRRLVGGAYGLA